MYPLGSPINEFWYMIYGSQGSVLLTVLNVWNIFAVSAICFAPKILADHRRIPRSALHTKTPLVFLDALRLPLSFLFMASIFRNFISVNVIYGLLLFAAVLAAYNLKRRLGRIPASRSMEAFAALSPEMQENVNNVFKNGISGEARAKGQSNFTVATPDEDPFA